MPEAGDLSDAEYAALSEQSGAGRVQHVRVRHDRLHAAHLEAGACGVVVVAVGGGDRAEKLPGALLPRVGGQDCDDLKLGVEGDAGDLFAYQDGVLDAAAGLFHRHQAQPPAASPRAVPVPRSAAFHISPSCTHR